MSFCDDVCKSFETSSLTCKLSFNNTSDQILEHDYYHPHIGASSQDLSCLTAREAITHLSEYKTHFLFYRKYTSLWPSKEVGDPFINVGTSACFPSTNLENPNSFRQNSIEVALNVSRLIRSLGNATVKTEPCDEEDDNRIVSIEDRMELELEIADSHEDILRDIMKIVRAQRLAELSYSQDVNKLVLIRNAMHTNARLLRSILTQYFWDERITRWAHKFILENLDVDYLVVYLDLLQALRPMSVALFDIAFVLPPDRRAVAEELARFLVKPAFDLSPSTCLKIRPTPLVKSPIILCIPPIPIQANEYAFSFSDRYSEFFGNYLPLISKTLLVSFTIPDRHMSVRLCAESMLKILIEKIEEAKETFKKPICLVGWGSGALLALKASVQCSVYGVVTLGFSNVLNDGIIGVTANTTVEINCPTLFVVGSHSAKTSLTELQDYCDRIKTEQTGIVVVGNADEELRMSDECLRMNSVTQAVVDRCILDKVSEFLTLSLLLPAKPISTTVLKRADYIENISNNLTKSNLNKITPPISTGKPKTFMWLGPTKKVAQPTSPRKRKVSESSTTSTVDDNNGEKEINIVDSASNDSGSESDDEQDDNSSSEQSSSSTKHDSESLPSMKTTRTRSIKRPKHFN